MARRPVQGWVSSMTIFDKDLHLDEQGMRAHFARFVEFGLGVILFGMTGELDALTEQDVRQILKIAVEELKGRVPLRLVGVERRSAAEYIPLIKMAEDAGVDAVVLTPLALGHLVRPTPREQEAHFLELIRATQGPAIFATNRGAGYAVSVELLAKLASSHDNVVGVMATHPEDSLYVARLREALGSSLEILVGGPIRTLGNIADGADGWSMGPDANVAPQLSAALMASLTEGDWPAISASYSRMHRLYGELRDLGGLPAAKAAMDILGRPAGPPRPPQLPVTDEVRGQVAKLLRSLNLL